MEELLNMQKINGDNLHIITTTWCNTPHNKRVKSYVVGIMQEFKEKWKIFSDLNTELQANKQPEDNKSEYFSTKLFEKAHGLYFEVLGQMAAILNPDETTPPLAAAVVQGEPLSSFPRLSIPKFSGLYEDWSSFHDLYSASVHNKTSISAVQKLQILKTLLEGEAEALLRHFQITEANYATAWTTLTTRYDNKRVLVNTQIRKLMTQSIAADTACGIRELLDTTMQSRYALEALGIDLTGWDPILNYIITQRLPPNTHALWEQSLTSTDLPTFDALSKFLEKRFRALESLSVDQISQMSVSKKGKAQVLHVASKQCWLCERAFHPLKNCSTFLKYKPKQRLDAVIKQKLCKKCFAYSHKTNECSFNQNCKKCNQGHNTLLHLDANPNKDSGNGQNKSTPTGNTVSALPTTVSSTSGQPSVSALAMAIPSQNPISVNISRDHHTVDQVLLATALVNVFSPSGSVTVLRALLDNGSQANLITERAVEVLGLQRTKSSITISGVGNIEATQPRSVVNFTIHSRVDKKECVNIDAFIMPELTQILPAQMIQLPNNLTDKFALADPSYGTPGSIDLLLSADVLAQIMLNNMKKLSKVGPIVQNTKFGWVLSGSSTKLNQLNCYLSTVQSPSSSIDTILRSFWEIETIPGDKLMIEEDAQCIEMYRTSHSRCTDGRYKVSLPFRTSPSVGIGSSRDAALSRFIQLERRFKRCPELQQQYAKVMKEYIDLGHMKIVSSKERDHAIVGGNGIKYTCSYLPHHGVVKESSSTTKLRVVFDASAKSKNGASLNDCLLTGPVIQDSLMTLLMRWRRFPVVMKADIAQMYRQIWVTDVDSEYQRVLWRFNTDSEIEDYRLTTVTFGVASAPFLAIKTLQQLALDEQRRFPLAAKVLLNDFYVDDLLTGTDTVAEGLEIQSQIVDLLQAGGFPIRKWSSNRIEIVENVKLSDRESVIDDTMGSLKALGLKWSPNGDCFSFKNPVLSVCDSTKRTLLSDSARLFDPLGWLAPIVILAKILFQRLWTEGLTWDEPLPESINVDWVTFKSNLPQIEHIKIPRWVGVHSNETSYQLHGFCDASEKAYAAVIYLRLMNGNGTYSVQLLCAKTRVAPVKSLSVARLELCGALLLAQLMDYTKSIYQSSNVYAWTDSEIVLAWLQGHPNRWKTFVANRVSEIQSYLQTNVWKHVRSADNPADCASRGVQADQLITNRLWWNGPSWLSKSEEEWPLINLNLNQDTDVEKKSVRVMVVQSNEFVSSLSGRFSSLDKMIRVTAFIRRWKLKVVNKESFENWLSPAELKNATDLWIRLTQMEYFSKEIHQLTHSNSVFSKSKLRSLLPMIAEDGMLRVGGRIRNANIPYGERHPIILPSKGTFTKLLIEKIHIRTLHGGAQLMLAHLRVKYWILNARNTVRYQIHKCVNCYRYASHAQTQLMADLPSPRLSPCRPFTHTGIDYAGPIEILTQRKPGRRQCTKGYICLFICFVTKAIHLELVGDLTSNSFLSALNRFTSRRGLPSVLYSDNGTNFVGAAKQLDIDFQKSRHNIPNEIIHDISNRGIDWKFIPPSSPHFGGLWEAGVKSTKLHLKRILGTAVLTFEEMLTVLAKVEACLNSRPLCPMTNDPSDLTALTPGHFLIGEAIIAVPRPSVLDIQLNRLDRFQLLQRLQENFWARWKAEYLNRLQQRPKWVSQAPNIKIGDLVLIKEDCAPPSRWALGRITSVHPGSDGLVRVATIKTATTTLKRPIAKLCLLPSES